MRYLWLVVVVMVLSACDTIIPRNPTEIPTWEYTAPTLAPTEVLYARPPTPLPFNEPVEGQNNPIAAALPAGAELPPLVLDEMEGGVQSVQMTLRDGALVTGTLYPPAPFLLEDRLIRPRLPGILLLGTAIEWRDFPERLRDAGYTVLVMDVRRFGVASAVEDILSGFSVTDSVYPALLAVMAAGDNADFALIACANDATCDVLVLLSPRNRQTLLNVVSGFTPRPMLIAVNQNDTQGLETAQALSQAGGNNVRLQLHTGAGNGVEMLLQSDSLVDEVVAWLRLSLVE